MCTTFRLKTRDADVIVGRTMEFAADLGWRLLVVPRGTELTGTAPDGPGRRFTAKHGFTGVGALGRLSATDGLNEAGLYAGLLYLPGYARYEDHTGVAPGDLVSADEVASLVLAQAATVAEAIALVEGVTVWNRVEDVLGAILPIHLVLHDRTGAAAVIEWVDGVRRVYDNPVGVCTNAPPFDWHLANLRNYVNLSVTNVPPLDLGDGVLVHPVGEGSGLLGLPGDWTPPSRFIRATALSHAATEIADADAGVASTLHILNAFDIPKGVVRDRANAGDFTAWSSVADLARGRYVLRTYDDPTPRLVELSALGLDRAGAPQQLPMPATPEILPFELA
jgi:choloylglycine hydrolase